MAHTSAGRTTHKQTNKTSTAVQASVTASDYCLLWPRHPSGLCTAFLDHPRWPRGIAARLFKKLSSQFKKNVNNMYIYAN